MFGKNKELARGVECRNCKELFFARIVDLNSKIGNKGRYCSHSCVVKKSLTGRIRPESECKNISISKQKDKNPAWKGEKVGWEGGHDRAQRWYKLKPCEKCGNVKAERHHKDFDYKNNNEDNIQFLCRYHHMEIDGRLHKPRRKMESVLEDLKK